MRTRRILFSLEAFVVFMSLTVYLWRTIETSDRQKHIQSAEISANQLKNGIESFVNEKISILLQVRNFWLNSQTVTHEHFLGFCREIISQIPGFQAIEYGGKSNRVVWIEPFVTSEPVDHFNVASEPIRYATLQQAIQKKTVEVTPTLDLVQGGKGFTAIVPIFRNGKYEGAIYGVFRIDTLFYLIFDSVLKQQYRCAVYDGDKLIYATDSSAPSDWTKSEICVKKTVEIRDHNWNLVLWPKDNGPQGGYLGVAVFLLGLALSSVLGSLIWLLSNRGEQADVYAALLEVSHNLGSSDDLSSLLRVTGDTCLRITGVDRCCIFLCNESDKQFEPAWISSNREEDLRWFQSLRLKYGETGIINRLIQDKRSLVPQEDSSMPMLDLSLEKAFDIGSLFLVPLMSKRKITGILTLDRIGKKHRFSAREQSLIEGVASQAAIAVENTRLLAEMQK
jgi:sensor domain CHASE-containing protein